jgi:hypothetical protein
MLQRDKFRKLVQPPPDPTAAGFQMVPRSTHRPPHLEVETANPGSKLETANPNKVIRFSSPKPWILATVLSLGLWAMLGGLIWWLSH